MTPAVDLRAYFERIRWGGRTGRTYDTLAALLRGHTAAFPFENLDVLLGRAIRLDLASLQEKLVRNGRGGYCFEQATLFAAVLDALGFEPARHTARVVMNTPPAEAARTHMILSVELPEGRFVLDPGLGSLASRTPVPLSPGVRARFGNDQHWLEREDDHWLLRAHSASKDIDCWVTSLERDHPIDFEMANYFTATYPASPFRSNLMMRAFTDEGRITVINRDLTIRRGDDAQTTQIADRRALRSILQEHFRIDLPEVETMQVPSVAEWSAQPEAAKPPRL